MTQKDVRLQLVVLLDGTGNSPENNSSATAATNVQKTRDILSQGINDQGEVETLPGRKSQKIDPKAGSEIDTWQQDRLIRKVFYLRGLGAPTLDEKGNLAGWNWHPTGIFGNIDLISAKYNEGHAQLVASGIMEKVGYAYKFLVENYARNTDIYLFGFSRGSYTARLLITLIRHIGLIDIKRLNGKPLNTLIGEAFKKYNSNVHPDTDGCAAKLFREQYSVRNADGVPSTDGLVNFLGLWDSVPGMVKEKVRSDNLLTSVVAVGRHAMSIDERRPPFAVQPWTPNGKTNSQQVWFPGDHCDVGGGHEECELSNHVLQYMLAEANKFGIEIKDKVLAQPAYQSLNPEKAMQHNSYAAKVLSGGHKRWYELYEPFYRPICSTIPGDEVLSPVALARYKNSDHDGVKIKIKHGYAKNDVIKEELYLPANLTRYLIAAENFAIGASITPGFTLTKRERAFSDVLQAPSVYNPDPTQRFNNEDNDLLEDYGKRGMSSWIPSIPKPW